MRIPGVRLVLSVIFYSVRKEEARTESRESITVGHHNLVDHYFLAMFQKPLEPLAFVVEARRNVFVYTEARI
jgi:hypothetical protein